MPKQLTFDGMVEEPQGSGPEPADVEAESSAIVPVSTYSNETTFSSDDIAPPLLRLAQGLSPEVQEGTAKPGQWLLSGFDPRQSVTIVPLAFARRRELRDEDNQILCSSQDAVTGEGSPGGSCAACPMNMWTGDGKNRRPPQCSFFYSYMVYIMEHDSLAVINFKRTALGTAKMLNSAVSRKGFGNLALTLTGKAQTGKRGSYYTPQITNAPADVTEIAIGMASQAVL